MSKYPAAGAVEDPALTLREEGLSSVTFLAKPFLFVVAMGLKLLKKISKLGKRGKDFFEGAGTLHLHSPRSEEHSCDKCLHSALPRWRCNMSFAGVGSRRLGSAGCTNGEQAVR